MQRVRKTLVGLVIVAAMSLMAHLGNAAGPAHPAGTGSADRILSVAREDNQAMRHLDHLVNEIGSRPANTVNFLEACRWAFGEFERYGLENVHLEKCGEIKGYFPDEATEKLYRKHYRAMFGEEHEGEMVFIYNVIADIRGSVSPDEYVIVGGHLDTSPHGPGAMDNGTGVAAVMEAARLLAESGVKPRRTIRFILFGGEEVGLVGSHGYVDDHPEIIPKISAVYNMDRGCDYISGIAATDPLKDDMRNIFATAMKADPGMPFEVEEVEYLPAADPDCCAAMVKNIEDESGMRRIVSDAQCGAAGWETMKGCASGMPGIIKKEVTADGDTLVKHIIIAGAPGGGADIDPETLDLEALGVSLEEIKAEGGKTMRVIAMGSSDHAPFLAAGVPAFWWEQDSGDKVPYLAHTAEDTYDKVDARRLEHSAVVIALGAFGTADLDHMLSREKLTAPAVDGESGGTAAGSCGTAAGAGGCSPGCGKKAREM